MHRDYRLDGADMSRRLPSSPLTPLFSRLIHRSTPDTFNAYAYPDSSRCIDCARVCAYVRVARKTIARSGKGQCVNWRPRKNINDRAPSVSQDASNEGFKILRNRQPLTD